MISKIAHGIKLMILKDKKNIYNTIYQSFKPYLIQILFAIALGFIGRFILLSTTRTLAMNLDLNHDITSENLFNLIKLLLPRTILSFILIISFRVIFSRLCSRAVSHLYDETTLRVSRFPLDFFDLRPVGQIATRFSSDYGNIFRLFGGPLAEFLSIIFDLISLTFIAILISPLFSIPLIFTYLIYFIILKKNQDQLRQARTAVSIQRGPSVSHFSETIQGAVNIKLNKKIKEFTGHFIQLDQLYIQAKKNALKKIMNFSTQLNISSFILFMVNGLLSVYLVKKEIIGVAQASLILSYSILLTQGLQMFFEWFSQFDEALIGVSRMDQYLRLPIEIHSQLPSSTQFQTGQPIESINTAQAPALPSASVEIKNLSLQYVSLNKPTLKNISLSIQPMEKVGLIGKTGSGKTSLISALLRLYPTQGQILLNNQNINDLKTYRNNFSVVSQDTLFLRGSLRSNLDLSGYVTDEKITSLLHQVGLDLPLDFIVEEKGQNLSFGEKQLISLVRCLIKDAPIIIFDEATAHIDLKTEHVLEEVFNKNLQHKTQIIIAHRLETIQRCDRLIWMDNGEIKKVGSVKEVLEAFKTSG